MKQYTVTGMSCAASASAASASPRACCTRSSPCTPTRSAPSCRRMISQDCILPLPAVCSRPKRSAIPPSARLHRVYGVWSGIRTSRRRQNQKMNCRKMKRAPKREFRCSFIIILCDTHCLAMVHAVYTVRPRGIRADSARFASVPLPMSTIIKIDKYPQKGYTNLTRGYGGIGRRARFRFWCPRRAGSSPVTRSK